MLLSKLPRPVKLAMKARWIAARNWFVQGFMSYGSAELGGALRALGVRPGDSLMLHSAHGPQYGFRGSIDELTHVFVDAVGNDGHVLMVSLPYRSASAQYLENLKVFDVRRAPSMMGMVSEYFRRRPEVVRSLNPSHPVLIRGPRAGWYAAGHEDCLYPCGPGTPFDKFAAEDGIVVFYNVAVDTFTFFHHLEHLVHDSLPFPLYTAQPFNVPVIDRDGNPGTVVTHAFAREAIKRRRFGVLEREMRARGLVVSRRIGRSQIHAIRVRPVIDCVRDMLERSAYFYEMPIPAEQSRTGHPVLGDRPGA